MALRSIPSNRPATCYRSQQGPRHGFYPAFVPELPMQQFGLSNWSPTCIHPMQVPHMLDPRGMQDKLELFKQCKTK